VVAKSFARIHRTNLIAQAIRRSSSRTRRARRAGRRVADRRAGEACAGATEVAADAARQIGSASS
jgi:hypothetical protein